MVLQYDRQAVTVACSQTEDIRTVEAVDRILVEYTAVSVEALSTGDVTADRMEHHCNVTDPQHIHSSGYTLVSNGYVR